MYNRQEWKRIEWRHIQENESRRTHRLKVPQRRQTELQQKIYGIESNLYWKNSPRISASFLFQYTKRTLLPNETNPYNVARPIHPTLAPTARNEPL